MGQGIWRAAPGQFPWTDSGTSINKETERRGSSLRGLAHRGFGRRPTGPARRTTIPGSGRRRMGGEKKAPQATHGLVIGDQGGKRRPRARWAGGGRACQPGRRREGSTAGHGGRTPTPGRGVRARMDSRSRRESSAQIRAISRVFRGPARGRWGRAGPRGARRGSYPGGRFAHVNNRDGAPSRGTRTTGGPGGARGACRPGRWTGLSWDDPVGGNIRGVWGGYPVSKVRAGPRSKPFHSPSRGAGPGRVDFKKRAKDHARGPLA